jgi:hypothetical protein
MSSSEAHSFVLADPTRNELTFGLLAVVKNFDPLPHPLTNGQSFSDGLGVKAFVSFNPVKFFGTTHNTLFYISLASLSYILHQCIPLGCGIEAYEPRSSTEYLNLALFLFTLHAPKSHGSRITPSIDCRLPVCNGRITVPTYEAVRFSETSSMKTRADEDRFKRRRWLNVAK